MKESELRKHSKCSKCKNRIGHTRLPLFWVINIKRYGLKLQNMQRQDSLAGFLGSPELARVMGTDEDMAEKIIDKEITLCEKCAMPIMELMEYCKE